MCELRGAGYSDEVAGNVGFAALCTSLMVQPLTFPNTVSANHLVLVCTVIGSINMHKTSHLSLYVLFIMRTPVYTECSFSFVFIMGRKRCSIVFRQPCSANSFPYFLAVPAPVLQ